ncbi:T1SS-143 repeat domain-containing protein [Pararhizobium sp.]|uniref:T1SS-143 repeat domain-containing protein n=1 Tax=Pararhizobium sp. TaxID=1977563 RepID=UPI0027255094|nr:tandem-95 repeat protein [Pararhizobium sp.]MDO9418471.1 tandem-95 repeat protein [Pararhizobium sp.]
MSIEDLNVSAVNADQGLNEFSTESQDGSQQAASFEIAQATDDTATAKSDRLPAEQTPAAVLPKEVVPDQNNVARLPANVTVDEIRVEGANLILVQADGTEITVVNGALRIPTFIIGDVEVPQQVLLAVLEQDGINVAAGPDGSFSVSNGPSSSGGDFDDGQQQNDDGPTTLASLLADTEFADPEGDGAGLLGDGVPIITTATTSGIITETALNGIFTTQTITGTFGFIPGADVGVITSIAYVNTLNLNEPAQTGSVTGLTSGGVTVVVAASTDGLTLTGTANGVTVFTLTVNDIATGAFTFQLFQSLDHPDVGETRLDDLLRLQFTYTVADKDGDTVIGNASIDIADDGPIAGVGTVSTVEDEAVNNGNNEDDGYAKSVADVSLNINWGADSANAGGANDRSVAFTDDSVTVVGGSGEALTSLGQPVSTIIIDGVLIGYTGENVPGSATGEGATGVVFFVSLSDIANGTYDFTLVQPLDHAVGDGATGETGLTLTFGYTATDADGDTASSTFTVNVLDDQAFIGTPAGGEVAENGVVTQEGSGNEDGFVAAIVADGHTATGTLDISWGSDSANSNEDGGYSGTQIIGDRSVVFGALVTAPSGEEPTGEGPSDDLPPLLLLKVAGDAPIATDEVANFLSVANIDGTRVLADLTSGGHPVTYTLSANGTVLTAVANGGAVFTVTLSDLEDGGFTFVLNGILDHPNHGEGSEKDVLSFTFTFTARDSDGDAINGQFTVDVTDDVPVANTGDESTVEDESLDNGNNEDDGYAKSVTDVSLNINWGADSANDDNGQPGDRSVEFHSEDFSVTGAAGEVLTSQGEIVHTVSIDGVLVGYTGETPPSAATGDGSDNVVFFVSLSDLDSGSYSFTLVQPLDHAAVAGENILSLTFNYVATDSDGDSSNNSFTVHVVDDIPTSTGAITAQVVMDDEAQTVFVPANSGGIGDVAVNVKTVSGGPGALFSIGADGLAAITVTAPAFSVIYKDANGFAQTESATWAAGPTVDGTTTWTAASAHYATPVATLIIKADGSYEMTVNAPIAHGTAFPAIEENAALTFSYTVTDGDSDQVSGSLTVRINDDTPRPVISIVTPSVIMDDEAQTVFTKVNPGGLLDVSPNVSTVSGGTGALFSMGADGLGSISIDPPAFSVIYKDTNGFAQTESVTWSAGVPSADGVTTWTAFSGHYASAAVLVIKADGSYIFTINAPLAHAVPTAVFEENAPLVIGYTVTDGDGDGAAGVLTVQVNDDKPTSANVTAVTVLDDEAQTVFAGNDTPADGVGNVRTATGDAYSLFSMGADGLASITVTKPAFSVVYKDANGFAQTESVTWSANGVRSADGTTTWTANSGHYTTSPVAVLIIRADGSYSVTVNAPVVQATDGTNEENTTLTFGYTARDGDGDTVSGTLKVNINDDAPTSKGVVTSATILDDEAQTVFAGNNTPADNIANVSVATGVAGSLFSMGADGLALITVTKPAFSVVFKDADGFAKTEAVIWSADGVRSADGTTTWTATSGHYTTTPAAVLIIRADGSYSVTINAPVVHATNGTTEENATLEFGFTVKDGDGDTVTGTLKVSVNDDAPTSRGSVTESDIMDDEAQTAFTPTNAGGIGDVSNIKTVSGNAGALFSMGADGFASITLTKPAFSVVYKDALGFAQVESVTWSAVGTPSAGGVTTWTASSAHYASAATLVIRADGSYEMTVGAPVAHGTAFPGIEENAALTFSYTVADADGDTVNGSLTVRINDDTPRPVISIVIPSAVMDDEIQTIFTPTNPGGGLLGGDVSPDVKSVSGGAGTLFSMGADGLGSISIDGPDFSVIYKDTNGFAQTESVTWSAGVPSADGVTTWTAFSGQYASAAVLVITADGSYIFTINAPLAHDLATSLIEDTKSLSIGFTVTDGDGDGATGNLTVRVNDDIPTAANVTYATTLDDEAQTLFTPVNTGGTNDVASDVKIAFGGANALFSMGADGLASITVAPPAFSVVYKDSNGFAVTEAVVWSAGAPSAGGTTTWTATSAHYGAATPAAVLVIKADGSYTFNLNAPFAHATAGTSEETRNLDFNYSVTDGDGDNVSARLRINVNDDTPVSKGVVTSLITLDDDAQTLFAGNDTPADNVGNVSVATGGPGALFLMGADGLASITVTKPPFSVVYKDAGGYAKTETVAWSDEGTRSADGTTTWTATSLHYGVATPAAILVIKADGSYSFTAFAPVVHAVAGIAEENKQLSFGFTVKDGDGDTVTGTLNINVNDDAPTITGSNTLVQLDDDVLSGNPGGNEDDIDAAALTGVLVHSSGADGTASVLWSGAGLTLPSGFWFILSGGGTVMTITQLQGGAYVPVVTATITNTATGAYSVVQGLPIDHPQGTIPGREDNVEFTISYDVTDGDGDQVRGTLSINVDDDTPTVGTNTLIQLDDDARTGGNPGGPLDDIETSVLTGVLSHSGGADGTASILWSPNGFDLPPGGNFWFAISPDSKTLTITQLQNGDYVGIFKVVITDTVAGTYSVTQLLPVMHSAAGTEDNLQVSFQYRVTDGDNDVATGTLTVNIDDDTPVIGTNASGFVAEDGVKSFTGLLTGLSFGADSGAARSLAFNGSTVAVTDQDSATATLASFGRPITVAVINGVLTGYVGSTNPPAAGDVVFKASLDAVTGQYTFQLLQPLDHTAPNATSQYLDLALSFTATDADGDTSAAGTITVRVDAAGSIGSINYSNLTTAVFVNLDSVAHTVDGKTVAADTATDGQSVALADRVIGNDSVSGVNDAFGGSNDDVLFGGAENNHLVGNAGNDLLVAGAGVDTLEGGQGDDTLVVNADIDNAGSYGPRDLLLGDGTVRSISLAGLSGESDALIGGTGNDTVKMEAAAGAAGFVFDRYSAPGTLSGIENFIGTDGNDLILLPTGYTTDGGMVTIDGGKGNDSIAGTNSADKLLGGDGNDLISGLGGDDIIEGGAGSDEIWGGAGNDDIKGGGGSDNITGGLGDDTIDGGIGGDTFNYSIGDGVDTIDGGSNDDVLITNGNATAESAVVTLTATGFDIDVDGDGIVDVKTTNIESVVIYQAEGADKITLRSRETAETITIEGNSNLLQVYGSGIPSISGISTSELTIETNGGNDTVNASALNTAALPTHVVLTLDGGAGDDTLTGSGGNDKIIGGIGADVLSGLAGDDTFLLGKDVIGGGTRAIALGDGTTRDISIAGLAGTADRVAGGAGQDTVVLDRGAQAGFVADYATAPGYLSGVEKIVGTDGNDVIILAANYTTDGGAISIEGGDGNDALGGSNAGDIINGGADDDLISGLGGSDTLTGGTGKDEIWGGTGDDTIDGGAGDDTAVYTRGDGSDIIDGGTDTDTLKINKGTAVPGYYETRIGGTALGVEIQLTDNIIGVSPGDAIISAKGVEKLDVTIGDYETIIVGTSGHGDLVGVTDVKVTGSDQGNVLSSAYLTSDTALTANLAGGDDLFIAGNQAPAVNVDGGLGTDSITYSQLSAPRVEIDLQGNFVNRISNATNLPIATDIITNFENAEGTINNDVLRGTAGANTLLGNAGNDTIEGRGGDDTLSGGTGDDTFIYTVGDGADTIDGGGDIDMLEVFGTNSANTFSITNATGDALLELGADGTTSSATNVEEIVISGGAGNDTLTISGNLNGTGVAQNTIHFDGGDGDDILDVSGRQSAHRVVAEGGEGNETGGDTVKLGFAYDAAGDVYTKIFAEDGTTVIGVQITHMIGGVPVTDRFTNFENFQFSDVTKTIDTLFDPVIQSGAPAATVFEAGGLNNVVTADLAANYRFEPTRNVDTVAAQAIAADINTAADMSAVIANVKAALAPHATTADALAAVWDYLDDARSAIVGTEPAYYAPSLNKAGVLLGLVYGDYLKTGGGRPLLDVIVKFTPDSGDVGDAPDRVQSLHDNLLGAVDTPSINDKFGSDPALLANLKAQILAAGLTDRPIFSGNEGATNNALAWDLSHGFLHAATGQLTATDVDDDAVLTWSIDGPATYGTMVIDSSGKWTYTLDNSLAATQSLAEGETKTLTYTATVTDDTGAIDTIPVTITVVGTNDAPVIGGINAFAIDEDTTWSVDFNTIKSFIDSQVSDVDTVQADLEYKVFVNGTLVSTFTSTTIPASGISYTPAANFNGPLDAKLVVSDGIATTTRDFNINVTAVNDVPVLSNVATVSVNEDTALYLRNAGWVASDPDTLDGKVPTVTLTLTATSGVLNAFTGGLSGDFDIVSSNGGKTLTITTHADGGNRDAYDILNSLLRGDNFNANTNKNGISFTPDLNANGQVSVSYTIDDHGSFGAAGASTSTGNFNINVIPVNDAPVVDLNGGPAGSDVAVTVTEQVPQWFAANATLSDVDSATLHSLTATLSARPDDGYDYLSLNAAAQSAVNAASNLTVTLAGVTLSITGTASVATYETILKGLVYTNTSDNPTTNVDRVVTIVVNDGTDNSIAHTATITVNASNDAPVLAGPLAATVAEGGPHVLTSAELGYTDPDNGDSEVVFQISNLSHGLIYNANATATSFTAAELQAGKITFVHDGSEGPAASFSVKVEDGNQDGSTPIASTFNLTVTPVNDAPSAPVDVNTVDNIVAENSTVGTVVGITAQSTDVDSAVTYSLTNNPNGLFAINATTGVVTVAAALDYETATSHQITVQASDGSLTAFSQMTINVTDIVENAAPVVPSKSIQVDYDASRAVAGWGDPNGSATMLSIPVLALLHGATDAEGNSLTVTSVTGSGATLSANHEYVLFPYNTAGSFTYTVFDGFNSVTATANVALLTTDASAAGTAGNDFLVDVSLGGGYFIGNDGSDILVSNNQNGAYFYGDGQGTNFGNGAGHDLLIGSDQGGDQIFGGKGNDTLYGRAGADILGGEDGNDVLFGGVAKDSLSGGAGNDTFKWGSEALSAANSDKITDYATNERIDVSSLLGNVALAGYVKILQVGNDLVVKIDQNGGGNSYVEAYRLTGAATSGVTSVNVFYDGVDHQIAAAAWTSVGDPIILDLDHNGVLLSSLDNGVTFDINADGHADKVGWTAGTDGILAFDVDGNGTIDDGSEIFSPDFAGGKYVDGLAALATLDTNHDGKIDADDTDFSKLLVWQDLNHNGISDQGELSSVTAHAITSLSLDATAVNGEIGGQAVLAEGHYSLADGSTGSFVEVAFDTSLGHAGSLVSADYSLIGSDADDTLYGGAGLYSLTGGAGSDTFVLDADAFKGMDIADVITDYNAGEGDVLDVSNLLTSLLGPDASEADAMAAVKTTIHGADTVVSVNDNGTWHDVAVLQDYTSSVKVLYDDDHNATVPSHTV